METHFERLCRGDQLLAQMALDLEQAVNSGTADDIERAFNVLAFMRNSALNASINQFASRCLARGLRVRKPCENKVRVEVVPGG